MKKLRLLHTSDWHLGHTLNDWTREQEHEAFLAWLLETIAAEQVDALLIAGDVFEMSNPATVALEQWFRFLAECVRRFPSLDVIAIGGNHDSASRLDAPNPLLTGSRLHVVGGLPGRGREDLVIPLIRGDFRAWVCAVPFLRMPDLQCAEETGKGAALVDGVRSVYGEVFALARQQRTAKEPLIGMGHLYMVGGEVSELSERKVLGGNQHALPVDVFPDDVAYVALGHLHKAQTVGGKAHLRYSGSPLPMATTEASYRHQVLLVDLEPGGVSEVKALLIPRQVEVLRIPDVGAASLPEVLKALKALPEKSALPAWRWPFVDLRVQLEKPEPGLVRRIHEELDDRAARLVRIERVLTGTGAPLAAAETRTALRDLEPEHVFRRMYEKDFEGAPDEAMLEAFHETLEAVKQEDAT